MLQQSLAYKFSLVPFFLVVSLHFPCSFVQRFKLLFFGATACRNYPPEFLSRVLLSLCPADCFFAAFPVSLQLG